MAVEEPPWAALEAKELCARAERCQAIWARVTNYPSWPARILSPSEALASALKSESRPNKAPVAFFGDSAVAWIPDDRIMAWPAGLLLQTTRRKYALLWKAILEAAEWIRSCPLKSPPPSPQKPPKKAKLAAPAPDAVAVVEPAALPCEDFPDIVIQVVNGRLKAPAKAVLALLATRPPRDAYPSYAHLRQNSWLDARLRPRRAPEDEVEVCSCARHAGADAAPASEKREGARTSMRSVRQLNGAAAPALPEADEPAEQVSRPSGEQRVRLEFQLLQPEDGASASFCSVRLRLDPVPEKAEEPAVASARRGESADEPAALEEPAGEPAALEEPAGEPLPAPLPALATAGPPSRPGPSPERPGCGPLCLNRLSRVHCDPRTCPSGAQCGNLAFCRLPPPPLEVFLTRDRGWGVRAAAPLPRGSFVCEYAGEVLATAAAVQRAAAARQASQSPHVYMMAAAPGLVIDAARKGSVARLLNSSCEPNCVSEKWTDAGTRELRVGIFALRDVAAGEELTYDYNFEDLAREAGGRSLCCCGAPTCRGLLDGGERARRLGARGPAPRRRSEPAGRKRSGGPAPAAPGKRAKEEAPVKVEAAEPEAELELELARKEEVRRCVDELLARCEEGPGGVPPGLVLPPSIFVHADSSVSANAVLAALPAQDPVRAAVAALVARVAAAEEGRPLPEGGRPDPPAAALVSAMSLDAASPAPDASRDALPEPPGAPPPGPPDRPLGAPAEPAPEAPCAQPAPRVFVPGAEAVAGALHGNGAPGADASRPRRVRKPKRPFEAASDAPALAEAPAPPPRPPQAPPAAPRPPRGARARKENGAEKGAEAGPPPRPGPEPPAEPARSQSPPPPSPGRAAASAASTPVAVRSLAGASGALAASSPATAQAAATIASLLAGGAGPTAPPGPVAGAASAAPLPAPPPPGPPVRGAAAAAAAAAASVDRRTEGPPPLSTGLPSHRTILVAKKLTNSDVTKGRVLLPRAAVECNLPFAVAGKAQPLPARDHRGATWRFVLQSWANGMESRRVYVLEHAGEFLRTHALRVEDVIGLSSLGEGLGVLVEYNTPEVRAAAEAQQAARGAGAARLAAAGGAQAGLASAAAPAPLSAAALAGLAAKAPPAGAREGRCGRSEHCTKPAGHPGFCHRTPQGAAAVAALAAVQRPDLAAIQRRPAPPPSAAAPGADGSRRLPFQQALEAARREAAEAEAEDSFGSVGAGGGEDSSGEDSLGRTSRPAGSAPGLLVSGVAGASAAAAGMPPIFVMADPALAAAGAPPAGGLASPLRPLRGSAGNLSALAGARAPSPAPAAPAAEAPRNPAAGVAAPQLPPPSLLALPAPPAGFLGHPGLVAGMLAPGGVLAPGLLPGVLPPGLVPPELLAASHEQLAAAQAGAAHGLVPTLADVVGLHGAGLLGLPPLAVPLFEAGRPGGGGLAESKALQDAQDVDVLAWLTDTTPRAPRS